MSSPCSRFCQLAVSHRQGLYPCVILWFLSSPYFTGKHVKVDALDAMAASHMKIRGLVVTTPNCSFVPEYPLCDVRLQSDGSWGPHDFAWWPQLDCVSVPHHSCIPTCPPDGMTHSFYNHPVLWHRLCDNDIMISDAGTRTEVVGFLRTSILDTLSRSLHLTTNRASKACQDIKFQALTNTLHILSSRGRTLLDQLKAMQYDCKHMSIPFRDIQRHILELAGLMIYAEQVLPRIKFRSTMNNLLNVRGSFTMDASRVQEYFRVGVPVWFIRPDSWVSSPTKIIRVSSNVRPAGFYPAISWRLT